MHDTRRKIVRARDLEVMQCTTMRCNALQCSAMHCNEMHNTRHKVVRARDVRSSNTQKLLIPATIWDLVAQTLLQGNKVQHIAVHF